MVNVMGVSARRPRPFVTGETAIGRKARTRLVRLPSRCFSPFRPRPFSSRPSPLKGCGRLFPDDPTAGCAGRVPRSHPATECRHLEARPLDDRARPRLPFSARSCRARPRRSPPRKLPRRISWRCGRCRTPAGLGVGLIGGRIGAAAIKPARSSSVKFSVIGRSWVCGSRRIGKPAFAI